MSNIDIKSLESKFQLKYALDRIIAFLLILLLLPVYFLVALLILIDGVIHPENKGSIFYAEKRFSAGKSFYILKFRTVTQKAVDAIKKSAGSQSITGNPNKTWAGKIILNWYLDELPQLFNILVGEMSFVGPRPHVVGHHEEEIKKGLVYRNYHKAGLLGIPQACKRCPKHAAFYEKMSQDILSNDENLNTIDGLYTRKCLELSSLGIVLFDLTIIFRGIIILLRGGGL